MRKTIVSPSILSANFLELGKDICMLNQSSAEWIHVDVMDGSFVPNISYGIPIIQAVRPATNKVLDVHLMIVQPERFIQPFRDAGADILTIHAEAVTHLDRTLTQIREAGMKSAVALNPATPIGVLEEVLHLADMVLVMSVNPGFARQRFIDYTLNKVARLRQMIDRQGNKCLIQVDGGINLTTGEQMVNAGADVLVAGNSVFATTNPNEMINALGALKR